MFNRKLKKEIADLKLRIREAGDRKDWQECEDLERLLEIKQNSLKATKVLLLWKDIVLWILVIMYFFVFLEHNKRFAAYDKRLIAVSKENLQILGHTETIAENQLQIWKAIKDLVVVAQNHLKMINILKNGVYPRKKDETLDK